METWVLILMMFSTDGTPAITNAIMVPLGISTQEQCEQVGKQWEQANTGPAAELSKVATCLKTGEFKP